MALFALALLVCLVLGVRDLLAGMSSVDSRVGISYNFTDRKYENAALPQQNQQNGAAAGPEVDTESVPAPSESERTSEVALTPQLHYIYTYNEDDTVELLFAPSLRHNFADEEGSFLDFDTISTSFYTSITKEWSVFGGNAFSLTNKNGEDGANGPEEESASSATSSPVDRSQGGTPVLSEERGHVRHYQNTSNLDVRYLYDGENFVQLGGRCDLLREDTSGTKNPNDYNRYTAQLRNEHRFNNNWGTTMQGSYIRGEYENETTLPLTARAAQEGISAAENEGEASALTVSNDVSEYRFSGSVSNFARSRDVFVFTYEYIGAFYDDTFRKNSTVHEARLSWEHRFSEMWRTSLGFGPSYQKSEGKDAGYGLNGLARLEYLRKRSSFVFQMEKRYDVENFDGTDDRGAVDVWEGRCIVSHQLQKTLSLKGILGYINEQGEEISASRDEEGTVATAAEEYEKNTYLATMGLEYSFLEDFRAGLRYSFSRLDAERERDSYDEHRVLMSLDWNREWFRW